MVETSETVDVSVIVPVYNDPNGLQTTIDSLLDQDYDRYEIIIADNGSTDGTQAVAKAFARQPQVQLVVEDQIQGSYAARNAGIDISNGDILAFLDADMWVNPNYVSSISNSMYNADCSYMGCNVEIVPETEGTVSMFNESTGFPIEDYVSKKNFVPTCCLVVMRDLINDVGYFEENLISSGDKEFGHRVHDRGYDQIYEENITVYHPARSTISSLIKKHIRIGRGKIQIHRQYPERFDKPNLYNPRWYLPRHPRVFFRDLSTEPRSYSELVYWFVIEWILKIAGIYGKIREIKKIDEQQWI